ncbi:MAG: hypothetical protein ACF8R7_09985 [Phycisphaerales bacterium JB039]
MNMPLHSLGARRHQRDDLHAEVTRLYERFTEVMTRQRAAADELQRIADQMAALARMAAPASPPSERAQLAGRFGDSAHQDGAPRHASADDTAEPGDPTSLCAEMTPDGILLSWRCELPGAEFAIWRRVRSAQDDTPGSSQRIGLTRELRFLDDDIPTGAAAISYMVQATAAGRTGAGSTHRTVQLVDVAAAA